jgi:hypothetical protein
MSPIRGIYDNGKVVLLEAPDWPEGCEVTIEPLADRSLSEQADDAESISAWLAAFDAIPRVPMSQTERAEFDAAIVAQAERDGETFERIRRLGESMP